MALKQELWKFWLRHRRQWGPYLRAAGLSLRGASSGATLFQLLLEPLTINYSLKGLEEFARDGVRGIEPGDPARSLFYHVFASPHVRPPGVTSKSYPTMADLELIENCVYSADFPSLADLRVRAAGKPLAVVVFAYEYGPAIDTVHRRHADLCFSRTGIARVGNAPPHYMPEARGYFPHSGPRGRNARKVHVVPARYGVFIATQRKGDEATIGPMRFQPDDAQREFWVPLHKLFDGKECIEGLDLKLNLDAHHMNEKIRRVHLALRDEGVATRWTEAELQGPPFRITEGLATFSAADGLVTPVPRHPLIDLARTPDGRLVGFDVPAGHTTLFASLSFEKGTDTGARHSPEFVHAKHQIVRSDDGRKDRIAYLPDVKTADIAEVVKAGGYEAANFVDYTADGYVDVDCPSLALEIPKRLTAYSILGQPDFFPLVRQQDLMEWWETSSPEDIHDAIFPISEVTPEPLSGARLPANFTIPGARFDSTEVTISAIIGLDRDPGPQGPILTERPRRESTLSYRASNLFQPGWDSSEDCDSDTKSKSGTFHLANYGLGSPYAEDTLICAALSAFWPGAVPDVTRFFSPNYYPSSTPVPDAQANWDGIPSPTVAGGNLQFLSIQYADYVKTILDGKLAYETFADVTLEEYIARTLATARVFQFLGASSHADRALYPFTSFRRPTAAELRQLAAAGVLMDPKTTYRIELAQVVGLGTATPGTPQQTTIQPTATMLFYSGPLTVVRADANPPSQWLVQQY